MGTGRHPSATILVVDDSPTARLQLRAALEQHGYQVAEAHNGLEGLEAARGGRFDLIIADLNMPIMTGLEMLTAVRQLTAYRQVPFFIATTEASDAVIRDGLAAGATGWLLKPLTGEVVLPVVRRALGG